MPDPQDPIIDPSDPDLADPPGAIIERACLYPSSSDCLLEGEGETVVGPDVDVHAGGARRA